jgi:hypothetical protein
MKRFFFWSIGAALLFILFFFGFNLFDSGPAGAGRDLTNEARSRPLPGNLEPGNGFFLIWGFAEPPETDPLSPGYIRQVRELIDNRPRHDANRPTYGQWLARLNAGSARRWQGANFHFPQLQGEDVADHFVARRVQVMEQRRRFAVLLKRYGQVLGAAELRDFTPLNRACPSPSLQMATSAAKLSVASQVLAALDGDWPAAGTELLRAVDAGFRLIASGRTLPVNALGKSMVELSLRALASLLNRPECSAGFARLVLEGLPDRPTGRFGTAAVRSFQRLSFEEVVSRIKRENVVDPYLLKDFFREPAYFFALERLVAMSGPRVFAVSHALASFFLKENETVGMMRAFWERIGRLEETPPWKWSTADAPHSRGAPGLGLGSPVWWLRNPLGKMLLNSAVPFNWPIVRHYAYRSHELKARYDLTRLLARARLAAGAGTTLEQDMLERLLAASGGRDPFSGSPYRFSLGQGALYSIGADAVDDGGRERLEVWRDSDIAIPIRFVKSEK